MFMFSSVCQRSMTGCMVNSELIYGVIIPTYTCCIYELNVQGPTGTCRSDTVLRLDAKAMHASCCVCHGAGRYLGSKL